MREIGSEFWDVPVSIEENDVFPKSVQWYLSGRSALQAIMKEIPKGCTVAMPSWCCESMIKTVVDAEMEVHFYPVYYQNGLIQEINLDCDVLFLMEYFGYSSTIPDLKNYKGTVIRDVTHSVFSSCYCDADYYFGSLRKWCGVWTGGYAWTGDGHVLTMENSDDHGYIELRRKAMELKAGFINSDIAMDKMYLEFYSEAEEILENIGIASASDRDVQLAERLDTKFIRYRRRTNAQILREAFPNQMIFRSLSDTDIPMFVPILVPDGRRDELRQYLVTRGIYCPIHWPVSKFHRLDKKTEIIYKNELSLVCDQRYTNEEMSRIAETVRLFMEA